MNAIYKWPKAPYLTQYKGPYGFVNIRMLDDVIRTVSIKQIYTGLVTIGGATNIPDDDKNLYA